MSLFKIVLNYVIDDYGLSNIKNCSKHGKANPN
jgi:hypothetical protein